MRMMTRLIKTSRPYKGQILHNILCYGNIRLQFNFNSRQVRKWQTGLPAGLFRLPVPGERMLKNIHRIFTDRRFSAKSVMVGFVLFGAVFLSGWYGGIYWYQAESGRARRVPLRLKADASGHQFINPLLSCYSAESSVEDRELRPFEHRVKQLIDDKIRQKYASAVSLRYQDLNEGLTFGINDTEKFIPASLWKVPIMVTYFKLAEADPAILTKKMKYADVPDLYPMQHYKPSKTLEYGKAYTADELIYRSIVYSDNNANELLFKNLADDALGRTLGDLGIVKPWLNSEVWQLSINEYSSFFRILYNASYLTREHSEKALKLLSKVDFPYGIVAGLPKNVMAAQKFGERILGDRDEIKQLHDCGIVYYPGQPYLLCIMTKGDSFDNLADTIRDISRAVYEEIDKQRH
jgi:beta-lactamase class A